MESFSETDDRWLVPNDRQLALRGRLETGWSSYNSPPFQTKHLQDTTTCSLTEDERQIVLKVWLVAFCVFVFIKSMGIMSKCQKLAENNRRTQIFWLATIRDFIGTNEWGIFWLNFLIFILPIFLYYNQYLASDYISTKKVTKSVAALVLENNIYETVFLLRFCGGSLRFSVCP